MNILIIYGLITFLFKKPSFSSHFSDIGIFLFFRFFSSFRLRCTIYTQIMHQMTSRLSQHFLTCGVSYLTQNVPCRIQPTTSLLYVTDIERIVIYLPKFFSINTHTFLIYCYYSPTNSTAIVLEHLRFTARMGARQILVYDYNQGGEAAPYDAPILRSPSVSRIRYVSDTDMAGIRRGYVSSDFYYF